MKRLDKVWLAPGLVLEVDFDRHPSVRVFSDAKDWVVTKDKDTGRIYPSYLSTEIWDGPGQAPSCEVGDKK